LGYLFHFKDPIRLFFPCLKIILRSDFFLLYFIIWFNKINILLVFFLILYFINFVTNERRTMKRWTASELRILKKRYPEKGAKYVSKRTGHPVPSVVAKANVLGIRSGSIQRWTQFEINYLLKNYGKKPVDSIARSLKRNIQSVDNKARLLKIHIPAPKKWSEEDFIKLRELWTDKKYSIDEVAEKLGKTRAATHFQAWKMGLRRPQVWRFWTDEETKYLKKNYKKKSYQVMANELGMTRFAVLQKANRLGLKVKRSPRPWTEEEDDYIRQHYRKIPSREIAETLNRPLDSIINRAGPLGISRPKGKKK
jgi:hypothetical protein